MSTRADNVKGELFQHYKVGGGRYRRLFQAKLVPSNHWASCKETFLNVLHADDARPLRLVMTTEGPLVIDDAPVDAANYGDYDPYAVIGTVTVYASLTHGTIWCRRREEFEGDADDGRKRFAPIDAIDPKE